VVGVDLEDGSTCSIPAVVSDSVNHLTI
jgi:hypothetical protein